MTNVHTLDGSTPPRPLPHNYEAEQGVLGAILINNKAYDVVARVLAPEHFFDPIHGEIYAACGRLIERGRTADPISLMGLNVGDAGYFAELAANAPTVINAQHYGELLRNLAKAREAIDAGTKLAEAAYEIGPGDDISSVAAESLASIEAIGAGTEGGWMHLDDAAEQAIAHAERAMESDGRAAGVPTGLHGLDRLTGGLARSEVTILAGRTGMGKTAAAGSIALNAARQGEAVAFFSLEMQSHQLASRLLSIQSGVSGDKARRGRLEAAEFERFRDARNIIGDLPLHIDEASGLTVEMISARARALWRKGRANLIVIDYLGLVQPSDRRERSRVYQIEHVTTELKRLAKSLNVPILMLAQISRQTETRDDKRPTLANLRDSGSIEQDAGAVLLIYRSEYYLARAEPSASDYNARADWEAEMAESRGKAEIIVAKNRHGPANRTVTVAFDGETSGFADLPDPNEPPIEAYGDLV